MESFPDEICFWNRGLCILFYTSTERDGEGKSWNGQVHF